MGTDSFLTMVARPQTWSVCSWVMRTADREDGVIFSSFRAVVMRRQEMPASMRMWVFPPLTSSELPLEPLARVVMVSKGLAP